MNKFTQIEMHLNEVESCVIDQLAKHSDSDLLELIWLHLYYPDKVLISAFANPAKLATMALVPLYRELLRRHQVKELEASNA